MKYMLDTNICIYAIKQKPKSVFYELKEHSEDEICISAITYAELVNGVEKSEAKEKNRLALTLLLSNIEILKFDAKSAEFYGRIKSILEKKGSPIGQLDMLIASDALSKDCILVTNNINEFERVDGLKLENWAN